MDYPKTPQKLYNDAKARIDLGAKKVELLNKELADIKKLYDAKQNEISQESVKIFADQKVISELAQLNEVVENTEKLQSTQN